MKSYKITESEKPLVEINHETPIPVGKQVLVKTILVGCPLYLSTMCMVGNVLFIATSVGVS